jgi:hypothetical protein
VVAASLAAEAVAWQKRNFSGSSSAFENAAGVWWWGWQQPCVSDGSMASYSSKDLKCVVRRPSSVVRRPSSVVRRPSSSSASSKSSVPIEFPHKYISTSQ